MIATAHLFRPLADELLTLLRGLASEQWLLPTSAAEWSVRDVAAHLLDGDLRRLSSQRDGHAPSPQQPVASPADLITYLNELNRTWVLAARRLSPRVLVDELSASAGRIAEMFEASDPMAPATFPVAWAGESSSRMWLDIAREYTERWHHQDQIREAAGAPPLDGPMWLGPVLETSLLALPYAYHGVDAPDGTAVQLNVEGEAGGEWVLRRNGRWRLDAGRAVTAAASITAPALVLCRLLLHRLSPGDATRRVRVEGDGALAEPLLRARAVMV